MRPKEGAPTPAPSLPAAAILSFLRQSADREAWTAADLARMLGVSSTDAEQAIAIMAAAGYITPVVKPRGVWRNTVVGNTVAGAPKAKPVARKTAEKNLEAFVGRVREVNADPRFLYRVEQAVVFGPFAITNEPVRTLDVAIQLVPKESDSARHERLVLDRAAEAERKGKHFSSYASRLRSGEDEVRAFLKARVRSIALNDLADWMLREPHRVVYKAAT
jgi:hypothetical protein